MAADRLLSSMCADLAESNSQLVHISAGQCDAPSLGPFYGAIAVPSVTRCRCRHCRGHRCAGGVRQ